MALSSHFVIIKWPKVHLSFEIKIVLWAIWVLYLELTWSLSSLILRILNISFVHVAYLFVHVVLHIFSPRSLFTWSCILNTLCWPVHKTHPVSYLPTRHSTGSCFAHPFLSRVFYVLQHTPTMKLQSQHVASIISTPVCQFVAQCCHHNFWNSFVEMHACFWTSVLVMVLWGHQPTWHGQYCTSISPAL